jgi:hypothetical protein
VARYPSAVGPLVFAGVKTHYDASRTEDVWRPNAKAYAELSHPPGETAKLYAMKPDELRYLSLIDGTLRVEELVRAGELDILHAGQIMAALLLTDGVRLFAAPAETEIPSLHPKPSITVVSDAVRRRMSSPLLQAVKTPGPAPVDPAPDPVVIRPPQMPMPRPLDTTRAAKIFAHGKRLLAKRTLGKALQACERACELDSTCSDNALSRGWCSFIKQPPDDSSAALDQLHELAVKIIDDNDRSAFAHYVYGRVALARGDHEKARRALRVASRLDPNNQDAKSFLRTLSKR